MEGEQPHHHDHKEDFLVRINTLMNMIGFRQVETENGTSLTRTYTTTH